MHRFYARPEDVHENSVTLEGDEAKHLKTVLRMNEGEECIVFDGTGCDYVCRIKHIGTQVLADIVSIQKNATEPDIQVTLYQAYPKMAKMEEIVQKAVEMGVRRVVPFISHRCVKRPEESSRLRRVVMASVKQCGRSVLPEVTDVLRFEDTLSLMETHEKLIVCWEEEKRMSLKMALAEDAKNFGVVIGPEGGLEAFEVDRMREAGGIPVTLGPRIMRTDTAGIAVLAAIFYDKGQMQL